MTTICNGCGGVGGRDCFNPQECEWISRRQEQGSYYQEGYRQGYADAEKDHLAKGAQEWRPIETAPRNRMVMLGRPNDDDYEGISLPGFWNESLEDGVDYMGNDEGFVDCMYSTFYCGRSFGNPAYQNAGFQPTHWMPLPAAPMLSQRGEVR